MATGQGENNSIVSILDDNDITLLKPSRAESLPIISESDFVKTVGFVEDIFVGEDFQARHSDYFTTHCTHFSKGTDPPLGSAELENLTKKRFNIFRTYSVETATFLESELKMRMGEQFEIDKFIQEVDKRTRKAESALLQEKTLGESVAADFEGGLTSPRTKEATCAAAAGISSQKTVANNTTTYITEIMGSEIFEMLLTLKDYARFQELMVDYLQMVQGTTPNIEGLISTRHVSDDEEDGND